MSAQDKGGQSLFRVIFLTGGESLPNDSLGRRDDDVY